MSSSPAFLDPVVLPLVKGSSVLDVACGLGRWGALLRSNYWECDEMSAPPEVDGFDAYLPNVESCQRGPFYRRVWHQELPGPLSGSWDTVLACEIIEHLPPEAIDATLAILEGVARQRVILTSPNYPCPRPGHETILGFNRFEAHLSQLTRRELVARGYRITGAGFGNPESRARRIGARLKLKRRPHHVLESLPRLIPWFATNLIAYKDF